jgi:hypothetical protein
MDENTRDNIMTIARMAADARRNYADSKEWTNRNCGSCMTIRVPVALLNRIRDLAEENEIKAPA